VLRVAPALQGFVDEEVMEVLPALKCLLIRDFWLSESESELAQEAIGAFLPGRQACGRPVAFKDAEIESGWGTGTDVLMTHLTMSRRMMNWSGSGTAAQGLIIIILRKCGALMFLVFLLSFCPSPRKTPR